MKQNYKVVFILLTATKALLDTLCHSNMCGTASTFL